ncbi:MAG: DNA methyltransferase [Desulfobacterales bacterium]|nr:DNA methyltransferase [Desulfobacterales bacterium]
MSQNPAFDKLIRLLKELFQLDQPDLDFSLYRIMHARAREISQFLDRDLLPQVQAAFSQYQSSDKAELEKELTDMIAGIEKAGMDPEASPKVKELRRKIAEQGVDVSGLEHEVYDHLYKFFRRYYHEGDFLAKRVYKPGVYAIPYEGEEVKLHWANKDQYYIKTSEYLRDYAFVLKPEAKDNPMRVHFRLVDVAEGEHGNIKAGEDQNRVFILAREDFIAEEDGEAGSELVIRFEYRPATLADWSDEAKQQATEAARKKPPIQKVLRDDAVRRILAIEDETLTPWLAELVKPHIKANDEQADYSRLAGHLNRYTARNTFDYFIHKDLGGFLRRELDFYIKNEVMFLDDIESETVPRVEQYLSKIKVIRQIAGKIIDFLAQLENFQKKLWLKKKFVTETSWCIRAGCIPEGFYPEIAANDKQREEWVSLHAIDEIEGDLLTDGYSEPITSEFLKAHPTLMVDTRHFDEGFTQRLLEAMGDIDGQTDGVLINAENFSALSVTQQKYERKIDAIYVDPPYNTDASAILYKNNYKNSSWLSLMNDRICLSRPLLRAAGIFCSAIDDEQFTELKQLLSVAFSKEVGVAAVRSNPQSRKSRGTFSPSHEYAIFYADSHEGAPGALAMTDKRLARYPKKDEKGNYAWMNFIRTGTNDKRSDRPKLFYPIFVSDNNDIRIPDMEWSGDIEPYGAYVLKEDPASNETIVYPVAVQNGNTIEKNWHRGHIRVQSDFNEYRARRDNAGKISIDFKTRIDEESTPITWWDRKEYASSNYGAAELKALFGEKPFDFPKALALVSDCIRASTSYIDSTILDYFTGSGTTGHAVINLNREDGGQRKFILVEMGDYFDTVLLPRLKKVTFSPEWKNGKPKRLATDEEAERSPRMMKVIRLESYEDALNNLEIHRSEDQGSLLKFAGAQGPDRLREQYLLRYMLDVETRESQSLLNIAAFTDPTAYRLKIKRPGSEETREINVDLIETFNWLIGLTVESMAAPQTVTAAFKSDSDPDLPKDVPRRLLIDGRVREAADGPWWFRTVTGTTPDGRKTLVIWRKLTGDPEQDNLVLDEWFQKQGYSSKDSEFDLIYVNGDNNLENLRQPEVTWKVRLIEQDFHRLMFEEAAS